MRKSMKNKALYSKSDMQTGKKPKKTIYSTPADTVSFHPVQKDPEGKTVLSLGLMYNHEPTSA